MPTPGPSPQSRIVARAADVALAATLVVVGLLEVWVPFSSRAGSGSAWLTSVSVMLVAGSLVFRRVHPLGVQVFMAAALVVVGLTGPTYVLFFGTFVPLGAAVFATARHGRGHAPWWGAGLAAGTLLMADLTIAALQAPGEIVFHWGVFVLVWLAGFTLAVLDRRSSAATRRAIEVEVAAAEATLAAVVEERTRIARELHDIVAHSVTMMVVQAGAAELVVEEDPDFATRALGTIRTTGNDALAEMRRLVAMLRSADDESVLTPQPGLQGVPALIEDARTTGLVAAFEIEGTPGALPVGLDLAAYRIVQEALTNVRRHSSASRVLVRLSYSPDELGIDVTDDGVGVPTEHSDGDRAGHGLIGMRERAGLYGGRLETEVRPGAGFTVRARLPLSGLSEQSQVQS